LNQRSIAIINKTPAILAHHPARSILFSAPEGFIVEVADDDEVVLAAVLDPVAVGVAVPDAGSSVLLDTNAAELQLAFVHADGILLKAPPTKFTAAR